MGLVSHWVSWQLGGTHLRPCSVGRVFSRSTWPRAGRWVLHVLVVVVRRCRCRRSSSSLSFVVVVFVRRCRCRSSCRCRSWLSLSTRLACSSPYRGFFWSRALLGSLRAFARGVAGGDAGGAMGLVSSWVSWQLGATHLVCGHAQWGCGFRVRGGVRASSGRIRGARCRHRVRAEGRWLIWLVVENAVMGSLTRHGSSVGC